MKFCNTKYYYLNARPCSATALMLAADSLIAAGEMSYVQQYLWTGDKNKYNGGAIKYDLDYVITNYNTNTDTKARINSTLTPKQHIAKHTNRRYATTAPWQTVPVTGRPFR